MRNQEIGFTVFKLFIAVSTVFLSYFLSLCIYAIFLGNLYCTQSSVLNTLQIDHPKITRVLKIDRNIFTYTIVYTENTDGYISKYFLNSSILFNYRFYTDNKKH